MQFCFSNYWDFLRGETRVHTQNLCRQREDTLLLELSLHRGITNAFISPSQWCAQCGGHRNSYLNRIIDESHVATRFVLVVSNRNRLGAHYCKKAQMWNGGQWLHLIVKNTSSSSLEKKDGEVTSDRGLMSTGRRAQSRPSVTKCCSCFEVWIGTRERNIKHQETTRINPANF